MRARVPQVWVDTYRAVGGPSYFFFVILIVVANYLLLNLVVALLIGSFDTDHPPDAAGDAPIGKAEEVEEEDDDDDDDEDDDDDVEGSDRRRTGRQRSTLGEGRWLPAAVGRWSAAAARDERSLLLFGREHAVRRASTALIHARAPDVPALSFDSLIVWLIVLSSGAMALESCELQPGSRLADVLYGIDVFVLAVFLLELFAKVVSHGLLLGPRAYLASSWNRLDGFIVLASLFALLLPHLARHTASSEAIRSLRLLRVLRPLRLISTSEGMRTAVHLLLKALPRVLDVALVYALFLLVFAILGVQLFAGRLAYCGGGELVVWNRAPDGGEGALLTRAACESAGRAWAAPAFGHFDHVGAAALLLFEMASLEGWMGPMFAGIDAPDEIGAPPSRDHAPERALYFIGWIVVGSLLLTNLIVGVLIATFHDIKRKEEEGGHRGVLLSEKQRAWVDVVSQLIAVAPKPRPPPPASAWRAACHVLASDPRFESRVLLVILFNTALMAADGHGLTPDQQATLVSLNDACTLLFAGEAGVKLAAFGPRAYFSSAWQRSHTRAMRRPPVHSVLVAPLERLRRACVCHQAGGTSST